MARPALEAVRPTQARAPLAPRAPASAAPSVPPSAARSAPIPTPPQSGLVSKPAPAKPAPAKPAPAKPSSLPAPALSSAPPVAPKPEGTVREILPPWHVLQDKLQNRAPLPADHADEVVNRAAQEALARQEAANAMWGATDECEAAPPSSGVRINEPAPNALAPAPAQAHAQAPAPSAANANANANNAEALDPALSFKVYTLAELERRSEAPVSMRSSRAGFDLTSSRSSAAHWQRALTALRLFLVASVAWFKSRDELGLRPSAKVALRKPFDALGDELQVAVESLDWKKLGVTTGIVVGATLTLLFAVLTAAELTDDLKPPARLASTESSGISARTALGGSAVAPATNMAAMGVQPVAPQVMFSVPAVPGATQGATTIGDIDTPDTSEAAAAPARKTGARKAARPKSTVSAGSAVSTGSSKLSLRSAPF